MVVDPEKCTKGIMSLNLVCPTKYVQWPKTPLPRGKVPSYRNGSFSIKAIDLNVTDCTAEPPVIPSPRQAIAKRPPIEREPDFFSELNDFVESGMLTDILMYTAIGIVVAVAVSITFAAVTCFVGIRWCIVQEIELKAKT